MMADCQSLMMATMILIIDNFYDKITDDRFGNPSSLNIVGPSWNWNPLEKGVPHRYSMWN